MVFESLVANLINKYLAQFIDDVSAKQLNIGTWKGNVLLKNLSIKENAFDNFDLPFKVIHGRIGCIEANIPWSSIYSSPVICNLSDIYLIAVPNIQSPYNEEKEKEIAWNVKCQHIEKIENAKAKAKSKSEKDASKTVDDDTFATKLAAQIIKNVQIHVKNVHIIYEDSITFPSKPFQFGFTLNELVFQTQNYDNKTTKDNIIHKIISLDSLSLYLNCCKVKLISEKDVNNRDKILEDLIATKSSRSSIIEYIISPISLNAQTVLNRKPEDDDFKTAIADIKIDLDVFSLNITRTQFEMMLMLLDSIDRMRLAGSYRKWRPKVPVKNNPKLWWKFSYNAIIQTYVRRRANNWSWKYIKTRRDLMKLYQTTYKQNLLGKKINLEDMEKELDLFLIVLARSQAELEVSQEKVSIEKNKKETKKGWFSFWSSKKEEVTTDEGDIVEDFKKEMNDEEKAKLYEAIGYQENGFLDMPKKFVAHKLLFTLHKVNIVVEDECEPIMRFSLSSVDLKINHRPSSQGIHVNSIVKSVNIKGCSGINLIDDYTKKDVLLFDFKLNPLSGHYDYGVFIKMAGFKLIYDSTTITKMIEMLSPPKDISLEELQSIALTKIGELKHKTALRLEYAIEKHKQLKVSVEIEPSFVVIPQNGILTSGKGNDVLILSLGKFTVNSKLIPKEERPQVRKLINTMSAIEVMEKMKQSVYESYHLQIEQLQVILSNDNLWQEDINLKVYSSRHLLCPVSAELTLEPCIITDPHLSKLIIKAFLSEIQVKISDNQVKRLLTLLINLPLGPEKKIMDSTVEVDSYKKIYQKIAKVSSSELINKALDYAVNQVQTVESPSKQTKSDETSNEVDKKDGKINVTYVIKFNFTLKKVELMLMEYENDLFRPLSLALLYKFVVDGGILSDDTIKAELLIEDLIMDDIRDNEITNGIRTLLQKKNEIQSEEILRIDFMQNNEERFLGIKMSGFRLIFALDYILKILDFTTRAFDFQTEQDDNDNDQNQIQIHELKKSEVKETKTKSTVMNIIIFNMMKVDIVLLESLTHVDTTAIILTCCSEISLRQKNDFLQFTGEVTDICMLLTNYQRYLSSPFDIDASILQPTKLDIHGTLEGQNQNFDIMMQELKIFISPPMVDIIVNVLTKLGSTPNNESDKNQESVCFSELFKPHKNEKNWYLSYIPVAEEVTESFVNLTLEQDEVDFDSYKNFPQKVIFNINTINVIIESGGVDSQQLMMFNSSIQGKMDGYKVLFANLSLAASYYNNQNFHWEPLIEPCEDSQKDWNFEVNVLLAKNGKKTIKVKCEQQLELTLTKTSLASMSFLNETFTSAIYQKLPSREENKIIVKNYLGIDLAIDLLASNLKIKDSTDKKLFIKSNNETTFYSEDNKSLKLIYEFKLIDDLDIKKEFNIVRHESKSFGFSFNNLKWIIEIEVNDAFSKTITFQSTVKILNKFNYFLNFYYLCGKEKFIGIAPPQSHLHVPLKLVFSNLSRIAVKPSEEYHFGDNFVDWNKIGVDQRIIITCESKESKKKRFYIKSFCEINTIYDNENQIEIKQNLIRFQPILRLRNLLPYNLRYSIEEVNYQQDLPIGEEDDLFLIKLGEMGLNLTLCDYLNCDWICYKKLSGFVEENEISIWSFLNKNQQVTNLVTRLTIEESIIIISIFSPFWMFNKTFKPITYKTSDDNVVVHDESLDSPVLLCFKPKSLFSKKTLSISIDDSQFSNGFPIDVVGSHGNMLIKSKNGRYNYCVSIGITLSRISLTKIVTITSFYNVINSSSKVIEISEDNEEWFVIDKSSSKPFWPFYRTNDPILIFRFYGSCIASKPLSLCDASATLILIDHEYLHVDVDITESEITVRISDYFHGSAPVLLVNALPKSMITYGQNEISKRLYLPPHESVLFAWYEPLKPKVLAYQIDDRKEETTDLKQDFLIEIEGSPSVFVVSFLDSKQRILLFTIDFSLATNALHAWEIAKPLLCFELIMKGIGLSLVDNEAKKEIIYLSITSSDILWEFRKNGARRYKPLSVKAIEQIEDCYQRLLLGHKSGHHSKSIVTTEDGCQIDFADLKSPIMIDPQKGLLRRFSNRGIWFSCKMSEHTMQCHLKINRIQFDNQLPDCIFSIIMCPVSPPKSIANDQIPKSFLEFTTLIQRQATMLRFKSSQILIQEFLIQIDQGLLKALLSLSEGVTFRKKQTNQQMIIKDCIEIMKMEKVEQIPLSRKNYFDLIHFSPLKVHVSFSLGGADASQFPFGFDFIIKSAGVTLTEFNDVVFKLNYFERKNVLIENSELISLVIGHYKNQVLRQFYVLILGLDLIGNPVQLLMGLQQGVGDFFYEPFLGIIQGPEEFAEGLVLGIRSLASHVVGGAAGALGRIAGTLGEGVSALTMDDKFKRERRTRLNKKIGIAESGKNVLFGFLRGVTGLITQPIEGVKEEGAKGLFKGLGRGVFGVIAQPTTGVIDFASGSLKALKRAIDANKEATKLRPARHFTSDCVLQPYNRYVATGHSMLNEISRGKFSTDNYIAHLHINSEFLIMVTSKRIMVIRKGMISHNWELDWMEPWENIDHVKSVDNNKNIKICLKESKKKYGFFSNETDQLIMLNSSESSQWLISKINSVMRPN